MQSWWSASPSPQRESDSTVLRRRFVEAARRAEILALVNSARTETDVARATVEELSEAFDAEVAFVIVTHPRRGERETIGHTGLTARAAETLAGDPLCRAALGAPRAEAHSGADLLAMGARHLAIAPWTAENGRQALVGVARLYDEPFHAAEIALLEAVTAGVGHGLERSWAAAERDRHAARQASLARAAHTVSASLVHDDVRDALCREVAEALEADVVALYEPAEDGRWRVVAGTGLPAGIGDHRCERQDALCAEVVRTGETAVCQPFEPRAPADLPEAADLTSGLAAPVRPRDELSGVVMAGYRGDRWIERAEVDLLSAFAQLGAIAVRNAEDHGAAQKAASQDSLTGCLNHGAFQERLREEIARAERSRGSLALCLLDLDDFKAINDTHGHLVGDALLRGVAQALREAVRPYDVVARYGGDEFTMLLPNADDGAARRILERALGRIGRIELPLDRTMSASAGLAHWGTGVEPEMLIARADEAMLRAKRDRHPGGDDGPPARARRPGSASGEREQLRRVASAAGLGARLGRLHDGRLIAETAVAGLASALGYEQAALLRGDASDMRVVAGATETDARAARPGSSDEPEPRLDPVVSDIARQCVRERRSVLGPEPAGAAAAAPVRSELAVPVYAGEGTWGALWVRASGERRLDDEVELVESIADQLGAALHNAELFDELDRTHLDTAAALAAALEVKDAYPVEHARSLADLAVAVGHALDLDAEALRELRYAAIFHDIGKSAIPDEILRKKGALTDIERALVHRHPAIGEQILAPVRQMSGVRRIVRHDHERWDGKGYPDGLAGEEIPLGARIVLVVDAYHAMRTPRPYRPAMDEASARAELRRNAGGQFDPQVVQALLSVLEHEPDRALR